MPIKFVDLLQQSWNFMRNQSSFTLFATVTIIIVKLILHFLSQEEAAQQLPQTQTDEAVLLSLQLPVILLGLASLFLTLLMIFNIQSINQGNYQNFFQNTNNALKRFLPVLILQFIMVFPIGLALSLNVYATKIAAESIIITLPLVIVGIYFFIKSSIVGYTYLLEQPQKTLMESFKFSFQLSRGKMSPLFLFCIIFYLLPTIPSRLLNILGNDFIGIFITIVLSAVIDVFMVIFGFRFYQVYRQLPANNQ